MNAVAPGMKGKTNFLPSYLPGHHSLLPQGVCAPCCSLLSSVLVVSHVVRSLGVQKSCHNFDS